MGKFTPQYQLETVQSLVQAKAERITNTALNGAHLLGLETGDVLNVLLSLSHNDFYKSMTTYADHREWQDVYRPDTSAGRVYLN